MVSKVQESGPNRLPKWYRWIGHFSFGVCLIFSIVWMYARVCNIDGAYQIFQMINSESFSINDGRYGMFLSQLLPLVAIRLHWPLYVVMLLYSVSFVLMAYLLYLIAIYVLNEDKIAFCMVLVFLCMRVTFLHALSETFQLMFFSLFGYALMTHYPKKSTFPRLFFYWLSLVFVWCFCLFIHPVAIFFLPFAILYIWLDEGKGSGKILWISALILLVCVVLKAVLPKQGAHDDQFLLPLPELLKLLPDFLHFGSLKFFSQHFFDFYYLPVVMWIWTLGYYLKNREILKTVFYLLYNLGFFVVTIWIYHAGDGPIGMERSFLPLLFFSGVPFVKEVLVRCSQRVHAIFGIIVALLLLHSFVRIGIKADSRQRAFGALEEIMRVAEQRDVYKIWLSESDGSSLDLPTDWGIGISSMLYSSCKWGRERVCNVFVYPEDMDFQAIELEKSSSFAFVPWWIYRESDEMNPYYFQLQESPFYLLQLQDGELDFSMLGKQD